MNKPTLKELAAAWLKIGHPIPLAVVVSARKAARNK